MKKLFLLSLLVALSIIAQSQNAVSLSQGDQALVYSLPKTELCIEVETEKITQKPGVFYRYSERYLATTDVIKAEKVSYRLKNIKVKAHALPDESRIYSFTPDKTYQTSSLSINSQGILCGVNVVCEPEIATSPIVNVPTVNALKTSELLPLGEEYMMVGSEAKLAEGTAKQIYRIRESRLGLLTADIEKLPADGESFKIMLDGLNKKETELTELFIGKITTETQTQIIYFTPTVTMNNQVIFRLSALKGIVSSDDLSGVPYYISILPSANKAVVSETKSKLEKPTIFYIQPISTQVSINDGVNTLYSNQFFIPQFGKTLSLPESLFKQPRIKIRIDSQTGRLLSVE